LQASDVAQKTELAKLQASDVAQKTELAKLQASDVAQKTELARLQTSDVAQKTELARLQTTSQLQKEAEQTPSDSPARQQTQQTQQPSKPKSAAFAQFEKSGVIIGMGGPGKIKTQQPNDAEPPPPPSTDSPSTADSTLSSASTSSAAASPKILNHYARSTGPQRRPPTKTNSMQLRGQDALMFWLQQRTEGYAGVNVQNFTSSWADGLAMCALMHSYRSDLVPFDTLNKDDRARNFELAFSVGAKLGVERFLDVEDMVAMRVPDKHSLLVYLSQAFKVLH